MLFNVDSLIDVQKLAELEQQEQIAGAGSDPQYLAANALMLEPLEESDQVEISLDQPMVSGLVTATSQNIQDADEVQYLENTTEYQMSIGGLLATTKLFSSGTGEINEAKLEEGSKKIDGENEEVQELLDQILEEAGLSEKPEDMSWEEYWELVAEAILEWLMENWEYVSDADNDYWQSVMESLGLSGDCEDFAILLASLLIAAGIDPDKVAVIISADGTHAYVAVEINGKVYLLDNNGEFVETSYTSLEQLLADEDLVGAWFKQGSYGVNNEALTIDTADENEETSGSSGTGSTSGSSGSGDGAVDAFDNLDEELGSIFDNWDEEAMIDEDGEYQTLNEEALAEFMEWALKRLNMLLGLAMALSLDDDIRAVVDEILSETPIEEDPTGGLRGAVLRTFSSILKTVQQAFSKLLEKVNKHNKEVFEEKMDAAKEESDSTSFKVENWYTAGYAAEKLNREIAREQEKYLEAISKNVNVFKSLIELMIDLITEGMAGGGKTSEILTGVVNGLGRMVEKIDEFSQEIDENLEECREYIEELEAIDNLEAAWDMFVEGITDFDWDKIWGGLQGMLRALQNELGVFGYLLEPLQWGLGIMRDPVEFTLSFLEGLLDIVATALDYIGEFIDKVIYTVVWALFGWIGYLATGEYGLGELGEGWGGSNDMGDVWTDWKGDDEYGTHGIGDIVQWIAKVVVDDILDNLLMDNLCDAIRFVLYQCLSYAWNWLKEKLGDYDWLLWASILLGPQALLGAGLLDSLDEPGEHDYFGIESIDWDGVGGYSSYEEDGRKALHREDLWGYGYADNKPFYSAENFQDLALDQLIRDIRGGIIHSQNAYRVCVALMLLKSDIRRAVFRGLTGLNGVRGNGELLTKSCELIAGPTTQILDASLSAVMLRASVYNLHLLTLDSLKQLEAARAAQCAAVLLTAISFVLAVVIAVITIGGGTPASALLIAAALTSVGSAVANAVAQRLLAEINNVDVQAPDVIPADEVEVTGTGKTVEATLQQIDQEIAALERALAEGESYLITTQDGMLHLDYKALANLERMLTALNNSIRILFYLAKAKRDINRIVQATLTGHADEISSEGATLSALESLLAQRQVMLSAITFQLSQVVAAQNMARQKQIAFANATASGGGAAAGALAALAVIPMVGAVGNTAAAVLNICVAAGSAITGLAVALGGEGNALGMTLSSNDEELDKYLEQRASKDESLEAKLDRLEAEAMLELLLNGVVGTGDGYSGLNAPLLAETYKKIQTIYQMKMVLSDVRSMDSNVRAAVMRELTGVSPASPNELTQVVNQANFNTAMRMAGNLSSHLKSQAQVLNQARDAEKAAIVAGITGGVTVAVSALSLAGIASASSISPTLLSLCLISSSFTAIVSSLTQLITSWISGASDKGFYEDYNAQGTVDKIDKNGKSESENWEEKLDNIEHDLMEQMNTDLIEEMECSMMGISADSVSILNSMDKLYNIRVGIAKAMQITQNIRAVMGHGVPGTSLVDILEANRSAAMQVLTALKEALQVIVERENQITLAQKQAIASGITLLFQSLALYFSLSKVANDGELAKLKAIENPSDQIKAEIAKLEAVGKNLGKWATALQFSGSVIPEIVLALVYNDDRYSEVKETKPSQAKKEQSTAKSESKGKGYVDSLESMDESIAAYDYNMAVYENNSSTSAYVSANNERVFQFLKNLPFQIVSLTEDMLKSDKAWYPEVDKEKPAETAVAGAGTLTQPIPVGQPVVELKPEEQTPQSTRALLDYADKLLSQRSGQTIPVSQDVEHLEAQLAVLENQTPEESIAVVENLPAVLEQAKDIKTRLGQKLGELKKLVAEHKAAEVKTQQLSQQSQSLQQQIDQLENQLRLKREAVADLRKARENGKLNPEQSAKLDQDIAKLESECARLEREIQSLKARLVAVEREISSARAGVLEAESQIEALDGEIEALKGEAAELIRQQIGNHQAEIAVRREEIEQQNITIEHLDSEMVRARTAEGVSGEKVVEMTREYEREHQAVLRETTGLTPEEYNAWTGKNQARLKGLETLKQKIEIEKSRQQELVRSVGELEKSKNQAKEKIRILQSEISALNHRIGQLQAELNKEQKTKEGKIEVDPLSTHSEGLEEAREHYEDDTREVREGEQRIRERRERVDALELQHKDALTSAALLLSHTPELSPQEVAEVIMEVASTDPRKAQKIYETISARITAVLPAVAPVLVPEPPAPAKPLSAPPSSQVHYDRLELIEKMGQKAQNLKTQALDKVRKVIDHIDSVLQKTGEVDRTISPQERLAMLEARYKQLTELRQKVVQRIGVLREKMLPQAQEKAANISSAIEREIGLVRERQLEVSRQIEALRGKGELSSEEALQLTALEEEAAELSKAQTRLEQSKALCGGLVEEVEQEIQKLEAKVKEIDAGRETIKQEMVEVRREVSSAKVREEAPRRTAARDSNEEVVVAVEDAGNGGDGEGGEKDDGEESKRDRRNPFSWLFGDLGRNNEPSTPSDSRVSYQIGNMPGEEAHEQYERVVEESNYVRSA